MSNDGAGPADPGEKYDVAVLGSHLAGSLLAAVLARHGVRVLLADGAWDATAPAGETTVPYTAEVFFTLARRFGVPEIGAFGLTCDLPAALRRGSGVKRSLGFLYHQPGREQDPRQAVQFNVPGEHSEWHPYRPDLDDHARRIALRYGARPVPYRSAVEDVLVGDSGVTVLTRNGGRYRARYAVDALGPDSPLVRRMVEAEPAGGAGVAAPGRPRHRSRVIAAHLRGVVEFERCMDQSAYPRATPWSRGTISHVFPGGWLQVVHFDNHEDAVNPLCGVTMSLDPERFADLPDAPDVAFHQVVAGFPSLARCFRDAAAAGPWVGEPNWQFGAPHTVADRVFLLERSASRNDMFLSRDVTMSAELVHALAPELIAAARDDDWSARRFRPIGRVQSALIDINDRFLIGARIAGRDFPLWNAFTRVWLLWSILAALSLKRARNDCLRTGNWDRVSRLDEGPYWFALPAGMPALLDRVFALLDRVDQDTVLPRTAAAEIFGLLGAAPFVPPLYRFADPDDRYYHFTAGKRLRMLAWSKTTAPVEFRAMLTRENLTSMVPANSWQAPADSATPDRKSLA
jgi:FADH2 O2-dependent halogenase